MNATKITGILLIFISLGIGYFGITKITDNTNSVNVLGVKIEASNESEKKEGYIYSALAIVLFAGGFYTVNRAKEQ
jgi:TRAP-type C4-dicarboxylate transport system permease small subunit